MPQVKYTADGLPYYDATDQQTQPYFPQVSGPMLPAPGVPGTPSEGWNQGVRDTLHGMTIQPVQDAAKALAGGMTDAEAQDFAFGAAMGLLPIGRGLKAAKGIRAYHGSPHDFPSVATVMFRDGRPSIDIPLGQKMDPALVHAIQAGDVTIKEHPLGRFDLRKIGTGEGAQAYGHGLYFAENEAVAADYRRRLADMAASPGAFKNQGGQDISLFDWPKGLASLIELKRNQNVPFDELMAEAVKRREYYNTPTLRGPLIAQQKQQAQSLVDWLKDNPGVAWARNPDRGTMYEVNINAHPDQFLDWDKPLSKQPKAAQEIAAQIYYGDPSPKLTGKNIYRAQGFKNHADSTAAFREAGIPGIKYLDQGSRTAGEGSRNYVVFDDKLIDIVRKYGLAAIAPLAAAMGMSADKLPIPKAQAPQL